MMFHTLYRCREETWYTAWMTTVPKITEVKNITGSLRYTVSLYWATASMTSTGYGDISSRTLADMIVASMCMIYGLLTYGYSIGIMAATLTCLDAARYVCVRLFTIHHIISYT